MKKKAVAKTSAKKAASSKPGGPPIAGSGDEMMRQLAAVAAEAGIGMADVMALLGSLSRPSAGDRLSVAEADTKFEAQELAFEAMEAKSSAVARKLAKRALELDPDCVDALVVMNDLKSHTQTARIEGLKKAVEAGKRSLGEAFVRENKGDFWGLLETRPTMRAMEVLAGEMASMGMNLDAIAIYEEMLELNPNDNQGVREPLLGLYLAVSDAAGTKRLLKQYKDEASACFAWARVIERLMAADEKGAEAALKKAIEANRFVALQLTGREPMPKGLPGMYSMGSVEEATLCQFYLQGAWAAHKDALFWVLDMCKEMGMGPVVSAAVRGKRK